MLIASGKERYPEIPRVPVRLFQGSIASGTFEVILTPSALMSVSVLVLHYVLTSATGA